MSERLRIGVVGAGWWSTAVHLPAIVDHPQAVLAGIADADFPKAEHAAAVFGAERAVAGHADLLELDLDCLVVATPHDMHYEPTRAALERGVDVLVEKPMVLRVAEAIELQSIAERTGARLHVGYTYLYSRHVDHLRHAISAGELGEIALATATFATAMQTLYERVSEPSLAGTPRALFPPDADTYADPRRGGGQALSQLTHPLSVLVDVLDAEPTEIVALSEKHGRAVDVSDVVSFRCQGALVSAATTGIFRAPATSIEEYRFVGEAGQAFLDTAAGTLRYAIDGRIVDVTPLAEDERYPAAEPVNRLIDCRLGKASIVASGELGVRVTRVLEALSVNQGADDDESR